MATTDLGLYLLTVLIWGSTWIAIAQQLTVPAELSIAYRFLLAAAAMLGWCAVRGLPLRRPPREHAWIALQAVLLFGLNYLLIYWATARLPSGVIALVFSSMMVMNLVNAAVLLRQPLERQALAAAALGLAGIGAVFAPELAHLGAEAAQGLALSLAGTYAASLGTIVSARNQRAGIPLPVLNGYGMAYGAALAFAAALAAGHRPVFDPAPAYVLSLLYLALPGTVIAFWSYLTLLARIGPQRVGYVMVAFPVVALALSTAFEGYRWTPQAAAGVALVLAGNLLVLRRGRSVRAGAPDGADGPASRAPPAPGRCPGS
ncbi:DMT family transporter [Inmirania thermothiophila]|uniref:Drug/metabolite transporter (DMT)-like permease n=1 Tax=Inmirania thermothiophila TaxID=1750597 RepID=A0A3N1Y2P8_9GAMM|nr:DMT family transporter [Inmirania thermothiophila]ROR32788.1 drug/metabolite transporter (DMT)-like permease [Inmirania thermothiophila]